MKSLIKRLVLGEGRHPHRIPLGLYRGLTLALDPATETNILLGLYEVETTAWLRRAIKTAQILIDVGAGYGELSIWGLSKPWVKNVIAYDSAEARWPMFEENLRLNGFVDDPRFVAKREMFAINQDAGSLQQLFSSVAEPVLLKIDVDGGEVFVLKALREVIANRSLMIFLETHSQDLDEECFAMLRELDFNPVRIKPAGWRRIVRDRRPLAFNQWIVAER